MGNANKCLFGLCHNTPRGANGEYAICHSIALSLDVPLLALIYSEALKMLDGVFR